jgi:hypothetical protein
MSQIALIVSQSGWLSFLFFCIKHSIRKMQYSKRILNLRSSTPNFMVYGEIGRFPVEIIIKLRMATFWNKMLCNNNKLSSIMYRRCNEHLSLHIYILSDGCNEHLSLHIYILSDGCNLIR